MRINKAVFIPLLLGFIVQVATAWNSFFFHSDEYFQIIPFAQHEYNISPATTLPWEFTAKIRPSLQVHVFALFYKLATAAGIRDRFLILSLLQVLTGISFFIISNYLIYDKFKEKKLLPALLWLNNFFWIVPYLRCRFSAEVTGALFWIAGTIMLEKFLSKKSGSQNSFFLFLTGVVFALSFYCRFQILFALVGVALWFLIEYKHQWNKAAFVLAGFAAGIAGNIWLDKLFYGEWIFTPYRYFLVNIIQGKANSFGTLPWWFYIVILLLAAIPVAGLFLASFFAKGLTLYKNPFAAGCVFFIIGHSIIGHKEERYMFPVILLMVYVAAEAYTRFPAAAQKAKAIWKHAYVGWLVRIGSWFSVALNILLIILFCTESYKQPVLFIKHFNGQPLSNDHIISFRQHPYETESGLRYAFLSENKYDSCIQVIQDKQIFLKTLQQHPAFKYCILLADAKKNKMEYLLQNKHAIVASSFIWNTASWLAIKYNIVIPDLWICQTYNEVQQSAVSKR